VLGNPTLGLWYYGNTDNRKALSFSYNGFHGGDRYDSENHNLNPWIHMRPSSAVTLSAGFRYEINRDDAQWVENVTDDSGDTQYVFGRIDQKTVAMTLRFNYTMTPDLSLQVYGEPFVSAGAYSNFRRLVDGRAADYHDRYEPYAYQENADFNYKSVRTTNVLRWEFIPGATIFVVWQQGRQETDPFGTFAMSRDFGNIFSVPAKNVFLVKLTYWLNR
jgi:hypothetical protein